MKILKKTKLRFRDKEEPLQVQLRRQFVFFPHLIPQELQAAVRDLDVTNRGVIWGRLAAENLLNPQWELEVQVPFTSEEGDGLLELLSRNAAERREGNK